MLVDEYMEKYKLLVKDIAYFCGVSRQAVSNWRNMGALPTGARWYKFINIGKSLEGKDIKWRGQALEYLGFPRSYR